MTKPKPKCAACGKPAAEHERNNDGTYLHISCAAQLAASVNQAK